MIVVPGGTPDGNRPDTSARPTSEAAPASSRRFPAPAVPRSWIDYAAQDQRYREYLEHMGVELP